jgi:hypothetical protein
VTFVLPTATDIVDGSVAVSCLPASGATFPMGSTTITCSAKDAHGNTGYSSFVVTIRDTTPPVLQAVPGNLAIDATGATGALVAYPTPAATDLVDGSVPVGCAPASGALLPIGDNSVACIATDRHGNKATAVFTVHVRSGVEQLANLLAYATGLGPGESLTAKVRVTMEKLSDGDAAGAMSMLNALAHEVRAQAGKSLSPAEAAHIVTAATRIATVLGA